MKDYKNDRIEWKKYNTVVKTLFTAIDQVFNKPHELK